MQTKRDELVAQAVLQQTSAARYHFRQVLAWNSRYETAKAYDDKYLMRVTNRELKHHLKCFEEMGGPAWLEAGLLG